MVYITIDGRGVVNNITSDEGDLIRRGTLFLVDGTRLILPVDHNIPAYAITSTLHEKAITGDLISYNITIDCTNNVDPGKVLNVTVPIPAGFALVSWNSDYGEYDPVTETWQPRMENQICSINLVLSCTGLGVQSQTVTLNSTGDELISSCEILAADLDGSIYYTDFTIDNPTTLANLQDGETYTLMVYGYVDDSTLADIYDGVYNNRVVVDNGETYIGERVTTEAGYEKLSIVFEYDSSDSISVRLYGQYQSVSTTCDDRWAGIGLYQGYQTEYSAPENLLETPGALLNDSSYSDITLESEGMSAEYEYHVPIPAFTNPLNFYTGIEVKVNSFGASNSGMQVTLESSDGTVSYSMSSFVSRTGQITFGDMMDLWGLTTKNIDGKTLTVKIKFKNTSRSEQTLSYSNITLVLYYVTDQTGDTPGFTAKGIHSSNYQLRVLEIEVPEGPDRDVGTVNFPLSDGETIVNYSLKSKEIKIIFAVVGDTLAEAKQILRNINQWLTNTRNNLSIPTPYPLILDFEPDMSYDVIMGESIETKIKYASIECEVTLTVESGVALTTEAKITGPVGSNDGIVKVKPIVTILASGAASITVLDNISGQSLTINHTIPDNTTLLIDCEDRTVTDTTGTDYTQYVDIESIWFNFTTNYNLTCTGGVVQMITFHEGY